MADPQQTQGGQTPQTSSTGFLPALLDYVIGALGGEWGPEPTDDKNQGYEPNPRDIYDLFTGGRNAPSFFSGASLDRVIFPPGPIKADTSDQALGLLGAILADQYNRKRPPTGQRLPPSDPRSQGSQTTQMMDPYSLGQALGGALGGWLGGGGGTGGQDVLRVPGYSGGIFEFPVGR